MAVGQPGLSASSRGHSEEEMFWSCIKHRQLFWAKTPPRHCSAARASRLTHMRRRDDNARNKCVPRQQNLATWYDQAKAFPVSSKHFATDVRAVRPSLTRASSQHV